MPYYLEQYVNGVYSAVHYLYADIDDTSSTTVTNSIKPIKDFIDARVSDNKVESVLAVFMMPTAFRSNSAEHFLRPVKISQTVIRPDNLDTYIPHNNKLLTYPYCLLTVDTLNSSKNYKFEYSNLTDSQTGKKKLEIEMSLSMSPNIEIICAPKGYNASFATDGGVLDVEMPNYTESVTLSGFPQCAFAVDSYKAWLAQSGSAPFLSVESGLISAGAGLLTGNPLQMLHGSIGAGMAINNIVVAQTRGARARNSQGANSIVGNRYMGAYFKTMTLNRQQARIIDNFFDRYGYATERIKLPNRNVRPCWTYTKTRDCSIHGTMPAEVIAKLKSIYDNGITFWKHTATIGDYTQNNTV